MSKILESLKDIDPFLTDNAGAIRFALKGLQEVKNLTNCILHHDIQESEVEEFTDELLKHFKKGYRFPFQETIGAIAVALEDINSEFADDYLESLASLRIVEMRLSKRIAEECLKYRLHNYD